MPLLLYCMIEAELQVAPPSQGVQEADVEQVCDAGLCCFYSQIERFASDPASAKASALRFHEVVSFVFGHAAVVPFRFPTLVADVNELTSHLRAHAAEYRDALVRLRGMVQMEVRIASGAPDPSRQSGAQYLHDRREHLAELRNAASHVRRTTQSVLAEWRERETNKGWRCYALVGRAQTGRFQEMVRSLKVAEGLQLTVTGPWPATEFIKSESP